MVEHVNAIARLWWGWSAAMFWQVSLLIVLVGCIDLLIRRWAWPQLRYALWSLILIKLLLPPTLSLPSGIVPELQSALKQGLARLEADKAPVRSGATIAEFGLQIADLGPGGALPAGISGLPLQESEIPDLGSEIHTPLPDSVPVANPQSKIRNPQFIWPVYALAAWLAGTIVLGIWLFLRLHSLCSRRAYRAAAASLPQSFYSQMADCASRLGLRHVPTVVVTNRLSSPAVFGVLRPVLLLPKGYLSRLSRKDTEHMLLHELAHIKRGDLVMHSLYMLLQISYWYNPLLWLVRRQMHHLRELSCDMTVANLLREQTAAYRQTLLETARRLLSTSVETQDFASVTGLLGLFEDSNRLLVRLNWLTKPTWRYKTMKRAIVVTIAALMIACVLPMARAQERISHQQEPVVKRVDDPVAQQMAQLEAQLQQLMEQQKDLQKQLRALAEQRQQMTAGATQAHPNPSDPVVVPHSQNIDKRIERRIERRIEGEIEGQVEEEIVRAEAQARRAEQGAAAAERKTQAAEAEAQGQQWRQWGEQMRAWGEQMRQWQNSDQMKRWQQQVQKNVETNLGEAGPMPPMPVMPPMPAMPPMGAMPGGHISPGTSPHGESIPHVPGAAPVAPTPHVGVAPVPQVHVESVPEVGQSTTTTGRRPARARQAPDPMTPPVPIPEPSWDVPNGDRIITLSVPERVKLTQLLDMVGKYTGLSWVYDPQVVTGEIALRLEGGREGTIRVRDLYQILESNLASRNLAIVREGDKIVRILPDSGHVQDPGHVVPCGEYVVESWPAGAMLQVQNNLGSVAVEGVEGSTCTVKATARIKDADRAEAEDIARRIKVYVTPTEDRVQVRAELPEGLSEEQRGRILIDFQIAVPDKAPVTVVQKVGGIRLLSLDGNVTAMTDVGSIEARQLRGDVALRTNVGSIEFVAPQELSAKLRAHANIGAISSDLPLEITRTTALPGSEGQGALGSNATGVFQSGDKKIDLVTNVGSIAVRRQAPQENPPTF